jgi:benzil reductase ((S)-benzoin forming)
MRDTLAIVAGSSSGIGEALLRHAEQAGAEVAGMSRSPGRGRHLRVDLADPAAWPDAAAWIGEVVAATDRPRVTFVHAAATLEPIGFAGEVDTAAYTSNVLLNSAAPQVLGHAFLAAMDRGHREGVLVLISSGAARSAYAGWSGYSAGKAACDQWVRAVGLERQERESPVRVLSVAPGVVATGMQEMIRGTDRHEFPKVERFRELAAEGRLRDPDEVAADLWALLDEPGIATGEVIDLRSRR